MIRQLLINLTERLADLCLLTVGSESLFWRFWNWNRELTRPERERRVREFLRRALREGGER